MAEKLLDLELDHAIEWFKNDSMLANPGRFKTISRFLIFSTDVLNRQTAFKLLEVDTGTLSFGAHISPLCGEIGKNYLPCEITS